MARPPDQDIAALTGAAKTPVSTVGSPASAIGPDITQVAALGHDTSVPATADSSITPQTVKPPPTVVVADPAQPQVAQPASVPVTQPAATETTPVGAGRKTASHAGTEASNTAGRDATSLSSQPAATPDVPSAAPVTTAASAAAPTRSTPPASPTAQIAPTLVTLARTADGAQQMTVRLHPAELGMVQVRIGRAVSGLTQIDITADKPETLLALQRDQPALHRTLDQAGVPSVGRTIAFHAVPPAPASSSGGNTISAQNGGHVPSGRSSYANADADGSAGGGRGSYSARDGNRWQNARQQAAAPEANGANAPADKRTYRAGLDITA